MSASSGEPTMARSWTFSFCAESIAMALRSNGRMRPGHAQHAQRTADLHLDRLTVVHAV